MGSLITRLVLQPGKPGTKRLQKLYGDQLLCVRYKYDYLNKKRYKTVELIISENDWEPTPGSLPPDTPVYVELRGYDEEFRRRVIRAGGVWKPRKKLWRMPIGKAIKLGLKKRIVWE